jgi:hypothetical protein
MVKRLLLVVAAIGVGILVGGLVTAAEGQATVTSPFVVTDDGAHITAENNVVKVIFHYKALSSEYSNRSGGSIYALFDKATDPGCLKNLVQVIAYGSGGSTPSHAGIGGFGSTKAHASMTKPTSSVSATSDNGTKGVLKYKSVSQYADGTVHASFTYNVGAFYSVHKVWTVRPTGLISLTVTYTMLVDHWTDDPNMNFMVSRDYGFRRIGWYGHDWTATQCTGVGSNGWLDPANKWTYQAVGPTDADKDVGTKHVQQYQADGAQSGVSLLIATGPGGYESSGLFAFGFAEWGSVGQITGEFSNYRTAAYGHALRWGSWYASNGAVARFKFVKAGVSWTDNYSISMQH